MGISSDRQFLGLVGYWLPGWFPQLPSQPQYYRRLRGLTGLLTVVQQRLAQLLDVGGPRIADGTLIGVANYAGCAQRSEFAGTAAYGYCAAKSEYVWGIRLVLRADRRGLPLAYTWVPANDHEYEPLLDLVQAGETVLADRGLWGRAYQERMRCAQAELLTPARCATASAGFRTRPGATSCANATTSSSRPGLGRGGGVSLSDGAGVPRSPRRDRWNRIRRRQGQLNSPLTAEGLAGAHRIAALVATLPID